MQNALVEAIIGRGRSQGRGLPILLKHLMKSSVKELPILL